MVHYKVKLLFSNFCEVVPKYVCRKWEKLSIYVSLIISNEEDNLFSQSATVHPTSWSVENWFEFKDFPEFEQFAITDTLILSLAN